MKLTRTVNLRKPSDQGGPLPPGWQRVAVRCSPDCPYEDCIINVIAMPPMAGGGQGEGDSSSDKPTDSQPTDGAADSPQDKPPEGQETPKNPASDGPSDETPSEKPGGAERPAEPESGDSPKPADESQPRPSPQPQPSPGRSPAPDTPKAEPAPPSLGDRPEPREVDLTVDPGYGSSGANIKNPPVPEKYKYLADRVFQSKLRNVMLDNSFDRPVRGRKRGRLDMRSLYKVPAKAENIFTLKEARKNKKYNVLLLVDESGSMAGEYQRKMKCTVAAEAAVFLAQSFEGLSLDLAIVGFNRYITVRKEFGQPADYEQIYKAISTMNHGKGSGDNNDWDALNKAYSMFKPGLKGENILIMLSDGQPASSSNPKFINIKGNPEPPPAGPKLAYYEKDEMVHLHHLVQANDRKVKSIGIGIFEGGGQIPTHEVIRNLDELKPAIIKQLAGRIKRG